MYFNRIILNNIGPIDKLELAFSKTPSGQPKPVIIVGQNGSGKSILLSHLVNALLVAKSDLYEDVEIDKGKVYKLRSPDYIKMGCHFSSSLLEFDDGLLSSEMQLSCRKREFEEKYQYIPSDPLWSNIPDDETSFYENNFADNLPNMRSTFDTSSFLYFPPNRFEEPAWLNEANLLNKINYTDLMRFTSRSNRPIINYSPLKVNQDWLMDIIFDSYTVEHKIENTITAGGLIPRISRSGPATTLLNSAAQIIKILLKKEGSLTFSLSNRGSRKISVSINGELLTNNMFSLSTGQTSILNMFLSLLRDSDLSQTRALPIDEIRGIVIIDEIDLHAHSDLQFSTLPSLISLFKNVQFIITSHSPLFLMGMKNTFGDKNFDIFDMPSGESVDVEKFSEFEVAYHHFKETNRFSDDIKSQLYQNQKPILYVEGTIDIDYIVKAGELLNKSDVIDKFDIRDGNGSGGLNKIYQRFDTELSKIIPQKVIILYDCDTEKLNSQKGNVYIRRIDREEGKISIGIENLFPDSTIIRVKDFNPQFVDVVAEHINLVRGSYKTVREQWCINKDEKRNMCNWLMQNGCAEDFLRFDKIIHELENIISNKDF